MIFFLRGVQPSEKCCCRKTTAKAGFAVVVVAVVVVTAVAVVVVDAVVAVANPGLFAIKPGEKLPPRVTPDGDFPLSDPPSFPENDKF